MPHINALEIVLATLAVIVIFGPKRLPKFSKQREPEMADLTALVERERSVLRPDFGQETDARRSEAGSPRVRRGPIERVQIEPLPIEHREIINR